MSTSTMTGAEKSAQSASGARPASIAMVPAFDLVIVGGGGDLSRRKLLPAMFHRFAEGVIPPESMIWCTGRSPMSEADFRKAASEFLAKEDPATVASFLDSVRYVAADSTNASQWRRLSRR